MSPSESRFDSSSIRQPTIYPPGRATTDTVTRIERVDVEGFKGIESLDFEPSAINVVTGRNNTGKTSLLEAIQLAFDPGAVEEFGENVDTLVNVDHDRAAITIETDEDVRKLELHHPDLERVQEILINAMFESSKRLLHTLERRGEFDSDVLNAVHDELHTLIVDSLDRDMIENSGEAVLLVQIDGEEYPFLFPTDSIQMLYIDIRENVREAIYEHAELEVDASQMAEFRRQAGSALHFGFVGAKDSFFVGDDPSSESGITFIDAPDLTDPPEAENGEVDAIKIDDIKDFLVEKEIVEDLRNFDLDYLVFDDDGEKYSVPYEFMGDGFKAVVGVLWELLDEDAGDIVLLEEPGIHMHPGYVRELVYFLVRIAREEDVQLFVTTHNNDFVSDFFGETLTDEERSFLREEFTLIQMQEDAADVMTYDEAEQHLKDLHLDLRGL